MNVTPDLQTAEEKPKPFPSLRDAESGVPRGEWFQFAIYLFVQILQWRSLIMMCDTAGRHGTANFITTMMISALIGLSLSKLSTAYKVVFFLSALTMSMYFLAYGW